MMKSIACFAFCFFAINFAFAQNSAAEWSITIAGENHDDAHHIITTSKQNLLLVGETWSKNYFANHHGRSDAMLVMMKSSGEILWQKTFGNADEDVVKSVCELQNGNFVAVGMSECIPELFGDCLDDQHTPMAWAFCIDENGNEVWSLDMECEGVAEFVASNPDGSISVAVTEGRSVSLLNLDSSGKENWRTLIAGEHFSRAHGLATDEMGNHYLFGSTYHNTNSSGELINLLDETTLSGSSYENTSSHVESGKWVNDSWLKKLNATGAEVWSIPVGNSGINLCGKMSLATNGDLLIPISTENDGDFGCGKAYDFTVVRISPEGEHILDDCFGEDNIEQPKAISILPDGSMWMLGDVVRYDDLEFGPQYQRDVWLQQTNAGGEVIDLLNHFSIENELTTSIATLPGQVIVVSNIQVKTTHGFQDDVMITSHKTAPIENSILQQLQSITAPTTFLMITEGDLIVEESDLRSEEFPVVYTDDAFSLVVFPNPANSTITVSSNETIKRIRILDGSGKVVMNSRCADVESCELNISSLAAGQYLVDVKTENERTAKTLIKE